MAISYTCNDFLGFQESLKQMRDLDDKIIYTLNSSLPTESFKGQVDHQKTCTVLYERLKVSHKQREDAIKACINTSAESLKALREQLDGQSDGDVYRGTKLKTEQRKLRVLQSELNVEDIVKERSYKAFNERCRQFFHAGSAM